MQPRSIALVLPLLCISIASVPLRSQTSGQKLAFEVASIKPNESRSPNSSTSYGTHFTATNVTLKQVILVCYRLFDSQLIGGPDWIGMSRFDMQATTEAIQTHDPEITLALVRSLLEDRFQLKVHRETRELPAFDLVVAKGGSKLQATVEGRVGPNGLTSGASNTSDSPGGVEISAGGAPVEALVTMLSNRLGRPIIDKTNLMGKYDFILKFAPYSVNAPTTAESIGPDVFTAIQEQLGLKLEAAKGPVEVLVIDSVQKPTVN